jgi:hypothetical protein
MPGTDAAAAEARALAASPWSLDLISGVAGPSLFSTSTVLFLWT